MLLLMPVLKVTWEKQSQDIQQGNFYTEHGVELKNLICEAQRADSLTEQLLNIFQTLPHHYPIS